MVNDSPALKRADVGFAMGSGTESAKEAGDLIIIDDNFLSIKNAIWYGRTIYENILKFIKFQLSINISSVLISAVLPFLGIESPLTVVHLLFVNLCMDSLGALLLGQEPALKEYMEALPRRRDESIVNKKMFVQFSIIGTYIFIVSLIWFFSGIFNRYFTMTDGSTSTAHLKTGFFALFMFTSIINGFNVRNNSINIFKAIKSNSNFIPVMCAMLAATFCVCQFGAILPIIGQMFNTTPLNMIQWLVVICTSVMVIPIDIVRKLVAEKIHK